MAIKGKGRTKSKQIARAPRREPVKVKPPFFTRRWVQVAGAALGGAAVILLSFWVLHGLHKNHTAAATAAQLSSQLAAGQKWQTTVTSNLTQIATPNQGAAPSVLPDAATITVQLTKPKSTTPATAAAVLSKASLDAKKAVASLEAFDIAANVTGKGFDAASAADFVNSKFMLTQGLTLYGQSADLATKALAATGKQRVALANMAVEIRKSADSVFEQGWNAYSNALTAAGINLMAPTGGNGLPGSGLP